MGENFTNQEICVSCQLRHYKHLIITVKDYDVIDETHPVIITCDKFKVLQGCKNQLTHLNFESPDLKSFLEPAGF